MCTYLTFSAPRAHFTFQRATSASFFTPDAPHLLVLAFLFVRARRELLETKDPPQYEYEPIRQLSAGNFADFNKYQQLRSCGPN